MPLVGYVVVSSVDIIDRDGACSIRLAGKEESDEVCGKKGWFKRGSRHVTSVFREQGRKYHLYDVHITNCS